MRKSKTIKQLKMKAAHEYKKGNKKEAYKLWEKARTERLFLQGKM
jgi:predicted TIM-barrel fold metal-dependent hydrolase